MILLFLIVRRTPTIRELIVATPLSLSSPSATGLSAHAPAQRLERSDFVLDLARDAADEPLIGTDVAERFSAEGRLRLDDFQARDPRLGLDGEGRSRSRRVSANPT